MAVWLAQWLGPLLLVSLWGLLAPASLLRRLGEHIQQFQESSAQGLGLSLGPGAAALPKVGWLEQLLDPFNVSDRRSFLQRYWVNDQHWVGQDGPIFLHLGGEGSLGPGSVMRGHPAALAPAWGALVISLEHRFYGLSIPAGGLEMAQLRFLSSRLALADVVSARLALSRLFNISSSSPWICFGGSYAGSLAAWARLKFPHLIFASVASSAPVRAVLDFSEYNDVVSRSLMSTAIGGSLEIVLHSLGQKCLSFSRAETVAQLRSTEPQLSGVGDRQWLYQTCTEFGFWDTDPWHVLSVTQALGSSESTLLIRTGSHCLDMAPERPSDSPSLRLGRQNIFQQLQTWLKLAKESQIKGEV
ncbi:thymus-specific serine protease isoform X4 [Homo sapiens]|uniref:thymus-specific serine protease isoform X4 n=1 Tax=Homo sapiens TaxID=9606 RepID=UPI0007DC5769|nr:thymus-specific serine protease isoform X4 [Homo sapiens]|eukprot:XP_016865653.1 thymus-specific serine protease isoform X4 [Homo sapiens]